MGRSIGPLALFGAIAVVDGFETTLGFFRPNPAPIPLATFLSVDGGLGVPIPIVDAVDVLFNLMVVAVDVFSSALRPSFYIFVFIASVIVS